MAGFSGVKGIDAVLARIRNERQTRGTKVATGLYTAGLLLQGLSEEIVPVDTSNLRGSADTLVIGDGWYTVVLVGYFGVSYGIFVHEDLDAQHKEGKSAKFLEYPLRDNYEELMGVIAEEAAK